MRQVAIIGGGISALATAYILQEKAKKQNITLGVKVFEKENRIGGKIWSRREDDYLCEWGPNGFLTNKPQTLELCKSLGLSEQLLASNDNARKRFVYANGVLHKLPHNQIEFLTNSLITWRGKLRIAREFFVAKRDSKNDESLADFARRRLGDEALAKLIAPMAGGIFAGDPEQMSLQGCFPRIYQLEQEYGGLLKAMLRLTKQHRVEKSEGKISASPAGPGGVLTSFANGIQVLTDKLGSAIDAENIICGGAVTSLKRSPVGGWQILLKDQAYFADEVILSTPAYASANLVNSFAPKLANLLQQINYSPLAVVCLGYDASELGCDVQGFGYLLARGEEIPILGTLWDSSIFAKRAPNGKILFRTMLGGAVRPELLKLSDNEIQQLVQDSLAKIMKITAKPELVRIYRHEQAIPQYRVGHTQLVAQIMENATQFNGLHLNNNAYSGVGINDCVAAAYRMADKLIAPV